MNSTNVCSAFFPNTFSVYLKFKQLLKYESIFSSSFSNYFFVPPNPSSLVMLMPPNLQRFLFLLNYRPCLIQSPTRLRLFLFRGGNFSPWLCLCFYLAIRNFCGTSNCIYNETRIQSKLLNA